MSAQSGIVSDTVRLKPQHRLLHRTPKAAGACQDRDIEMTKREAGSFSLPVAFHCSQPLPVAFSRSRILPSSLSLLLPLRAPFVSVVADAVSAFVPSSGFLPHPSDILSPPLSPPPSSSAAATELCPIRPRRPLLRLPSSPIAACRCYERASSPSSRLSPASPPLSLFSSLCRRLLRAPAVPSLSLPLFSTRNPLRPHPVTCNRRQPLSLCHTA